MKYAYRGGRPHIIQCFGKGENNAFGAVESAAADQLEDSHRYLGSAHCSISESRRRLRACLQRTLATIRGPVTFHFHFSRINGDLALTTC